MKTQPLSRSVCSKCQATAEITPELLRRIMPPPAVNFGSVVEKNHVEWVVKAARPSGWSVDPKAPYDVLRGICAVCAPPKPVELMNAHPSLPAGIVYQAGPAPSTIATRQAPTPQAPPKTVNTIVAPIQRSILGSVDRSFQTPVHNMVTRVAPSDPLRPVTAQAQAQILGTPVRYSSTPQRAVPPSTALLMAAPTPEIKVAPTMQHNTKVVGSITVIPPEPPPPPAEPAAAPVESEYAKQLRKMQERTLANRAARMTQNEEARVAQFVEKIDASKVVEIDEPALETAPEPEPPAA